MVKNVLYAYDSQVAETPWFAENIEAQNAHTHACSYKHRDWCILHVTSEEGEPINSLSPSLFVTQGCSQQSLLPS